MPPLYQGWVRRIPTYDQPVSRWKKAHKYSECEKGVRKILLSFSDELYSTLMLPDGEHPMKVERKTKDGSS